MPGLHSPNRRENPVFKFYIEDILRGIKIMGPVVDSNALLL